MQTASTAGTASNLDYEAFWQFSIATGILAEVLARIEGAHQEEAFTAGVLHQIGLLALDQGRPEQLHEALALRDAGGVSLHDAERRVFGFTDAESRRRAGAALELPRVAGGGRARPRPVAERPARPEQPRGQRDPRPDVHPRLRAPDGVTPAADPEEAPEEWQRPPLSVALRQSGGMAKVMEQAETLVGSLS